MFGRYLDALFYLEELREEGLIRHLGLTNFDTAHLRVVLASGIDVVSNQVSFSLFDRRARGEMSALCLEHGVSELVTGDRDFLRFEGLRVANPFA